MKGIFALILLLPLFSLAQQERPTNGVKEGGVHFLEDMSWQQVREKAKAEHKYIFVDCFASWCGPCKAMDKRTYPNDSVGDVINHDFVSMKIQCDTSKDDKDNVKARYADAHEIVTEFHITAYPTFLFFSDDGKIVHKGVGYLGPKKFIDLAMASMDPAMQYFRLVNEYQNGKVDYAHIPYLASLADKFDNRELFLSITRKYVHGYLDQLPDSAFFKKSILDLLVKYRENVSSTDKAFERLIDHPEFWDSVQQKNLISSGLIDYVVYKEEVKPSLDQAKKSGKIPEWDVIGRRIAKRVGPAHMDPILKGKMNWFEFRKDWEDYCEVAIDRMENWEYTKNQKDPDNREMLNGFAWGIFQLSNDKGKLEKALSWIELTVSAITDSTVHAGLFIDTKANLLYKLGRKEEALLLETKAAEINPDNSDITGALQKMKEGKPTW